MNPSVLLFVTSLLHPIATDSREAEVDAIFAPFTVPGSPGCSVSVIRDGEILFAKGYGLAQLEYDIPITPSTIFHVASVSKQFTCFAIALLAEQGELSFDDDIRDYLPEVPDFGETITIRHLMHHTSGLRDQWSLLTWAGWRMDDVITHGDVMELVGRQRELNFPPGDRYNYSNTGYTLMAGIVAEVSGQSFKSFCEENMFEPLGMEDTHFHDDHRHVVPNRTYSYAPTAEGFEKRVLSYAVAGATSLFTTVEDLALWQTNFETQDLGGPDVMAEMVTRGVLNSGHELNYALGLSHGSHRGLHTISHSGGDAGFRSFLVRFPELDFSVAVLSNHAQGNPQARAYRVADIFIKGEYLEGPQRSNFLESLSSAGDGPPTEGVDLFAMDAETLASFGGRYLDESDGTLWTLEPEGQGLSARLGGTRSQLYPVEAMAFAQLGEHESRMTFEDTNPRRAVWKTWEDGTRRLRSIEEARTDKEHLDNFVGAYYSEELDTTCFIERSAESLRMRRMKYGSVTLTPTWADGFRGGGVTYSFLRDDQGRVKEMRVYAGRVLNMKFARK